MLESEDQVVCAWSILPRRRMAGFDIVGVFFVGGLMLWCFLSLLGIPDSEF